MEQEPLFPSEEPKPLKPWQRPYSLYDGMAPHEGSATSFAAAASMMPHLGAIQEREYEAICDAGERGMTDDELEHRLGLRHQTASARRRELYLLGLIKEGGFRNTTSGRKATVWVKR
jgi:hypothetical protein